MMKGYGYKGKWGLVGFQAIVKGQDWYDKREWCWVKGGFAGFKAIVKGQDWYDFSI